MTLRDLSSSASSGWVLGKVVYPGAWKHLVLGSLPEPGHEMHYKKGSVTVAFVRAVEEMPMQVHALLAQDASTIQFALSEMFDPEHADKVPLIDRTFMPG